MDNQQGKERGEMIREIVRITVPAFFELLLASTVSLVAMAMLGHISADDLAAAGITSQPFNVLVGVFAAVNVGTTTAVAWNMGGNKTGIARRVAGLSISLNVIFGLFTTLLGIILARPLVAFMGAGGDLDITVLDKAVLYFRITCTGLVFQSVSTSVTAALRGAGEAKIPMAYNILGNVVNVFLCYALIFGKWGAPALGIRGAAIAATIARAATVAAALYAILFSKRMPLTIDFRHILGFDKEHIGRILKIGMPSAAEQVIMQSGYTFFSRIVIFLGTTAFAAHQIGNSINAIALAPAQAFAVASTTLVGRSLGGEGGAKAAKGAAHLIHKVSLLAAGITGILLALSAGALSGMFTKDAAVAREAAAVVIILGFLQIPMATQNVMSGALRGAGDTYYPLYASMIGVWVLRLALALVFLHVFSWGLLGAWFAVLIDQGARAVFVLARFQSGRWERGVY